MDSLENVICSAYAYIEAKGTWDGYCNLYKQYGTVKKKQWEQVKRDYKLVSEYLTDQEIERVQKLAIGEF